MTNGVVHKIYKNNQCDWVIDKLCAVIFRWGQILMTFGEHFWDNAFEKIFGYMMQWQGRTAVTASCGPLECTVDMRLEFILFDELPW